MTISTTDALLAALAKSNLLEAEQLAQAQAAVQAGDDARALVKRLVERELLTRWQAAQLLAGRTSFLLGKYKLIDLLGHGGMGRVFLARHTMMHRPVALKIISKQLGQDPSNLERFFSEARAVAALNHPNIVHAYNIDNEGDRYYMVMEYVEGMDLQRMVEEHGPLDYDRATDYIRQAADGLAHAHSRNLVHCDIKPANLLVNSQGVVKILDMGMARLGSAEMVEDTSSDRVLGTVDYMAPELALQRPQIDRRVDIYSLGCTFYYLLTGHPPFPEGSLTERILKHQMQAAQPIAHSRPDVPDDLIAICQKMMAKQPEDRYATADEVVADLAARLPVESSPKGAAPRPEEASLQLAGEEATAAPEPARGAVASELPEEGSADHALDLEDETLPPLDPALTANLPTPPRKPPTDRGFPWPLLLLGGGAVGLVLLVILMVVLGAFDTPKTPRPPDPKPPKASQVATPDALPKTAAMATPGPSDPSSSPLPAAAQNPPNPAASQLPDKPSGKIAEAPADQPGKTPDKVVPTVPPGPSPSPPPTLPVKAVVQPGVKAGVKPTEPTPTASVPETPPSPETSPAPAVLVDPFAELPSQVALPLVGEENAQASFLLGKINTPPEVDWQLTLVGGEQVLRVGERYLLQRSNAPSNGWMVRREAIVLGTNKLTSDVARLSRGEDGSLHFQWMPDLKPEEANYLRNCVLRLQLPTGSHDVQLLVPTPITPVPLDIERGAAHSAIELKWVRQVSDLRVEILKAEGPSSYKLDPPEPVGFDVPVQLTYLRLDRSNGAVPGAIFQGVFRARDGKYAAHVTLHNPLPSVFRSFEKMMQRQTKGGGVTAARKSITTERDNAEAQWKMAKPDQRNSLENRLRGWDVQLWTLEFDEAMRTKPTPALHFQVFLEIEGTRVILATTELAPTEKPSEETPPK